MTKAKEIKPPRLQRGGPTTKTNPTTGSFRVSDELWDVLAPLIPRPVNTHPLGGCRPRVPDRTCANGIFYVLHTGCQWKALDATGICSGSTAHLRFQEWTKAGAFRWGLAVDGANRHDMKLVRATLDSLPVARPPPGPEHPQVEHPQGMCLDKGYDFDEVRRTLEEFGFTAHIRSRGEEAKAIAGSGVQGAALGGGTHSQLAEPIPADIGSLG